MKSSSRKRTLFDVTSLHSEDWELLSALLKRAKQKESEELVAITGRDSAQYHGPSSLTKLARQIKSSRNQRDRFFDSNLFGEPVWDILLTLFIADTEGYRMGVTEVTEASNVPSTTALRWLGRLQDVDLVLRYPSPSDKRTIYLTLSQAGFARMEALLKSISDRMFSSVG
jgi:DNA-binding MarR family transcriptional regulator